jgi:hypothetical protein
MQTQVPGVPTRCQTLFIQIDVAVKVACRSVLRQELFLLFCSEYPVRTSKTAYSFWFVWAYSLEFKTSFFFAINDIDWVFTHGASVHDEILKRLATRNAREMDITSVEQFLRFKGMDDWLRK